ncbi:MAG: hypothetical protein LUD03_03000 [Firmicutes bacterium]|nr:hypothetical protein [Bacillota bacterium]
MGLFGGNYDKAGPGVDPNAPKKRGFFLYIDIVWQKLGKFFQIGAVYSLLSLPLLVVLYLLSVFVFAQPIASLQETALEVMQSNGIPEAEYAGQLGTITFMTASMACVFFVTMWGSGPLSAALSFVMREFTRGKYVWIWSDGREKIKENMKQGFIVLALDLLVFILVPTAVIFYTNLARSEPSMNFAATLLAYLLILATLIYTMMHPYMFQLMVTFDSKFSEIFKKSLLLALGHFPINLLLTAISAALIVVPTAIFGVPGSMVVVVIGLTVGIAFLRYPMEFYAARVIEKTFIKPMSKKVHIEYEEDE